MSPTAHHHRERHRSGRAAWLRAAVLGANDGLLSVASLMMGVGAASVARSTLLVAGFAALVGGALSMAAGEYGSVSSQRDTEQADLDRERRELVATPDAERAELAGIYRERGLSARLAEQVATELSAGDPLVHHARDELGLDPENLAAPLQAAGVSALSFSVGALVPVVAAIVLPSSSRAAITVVATLAGLAALGALGAHLGGAPKGKAALRMLVLGALALAGTTLVGKLVGTAVA
jgi:vacuolar iron transporter family protein